MVVGCYSTVCSHLMRNSEQHLHDLRLRLMLSTRWVRVTACSSQTPCVFMGENAVCRVMCFHLRGPEEKFKRVNPKFGLVKVITRTHSVSRLVSRKQEKLERAVRVMMILAVSVYLLLLSIRLVES